MRISPRYDDAPIVRMDGDPSAVAEPMLRQHRRFAAVLSSLTPAQWETPSRCDGWRVQDVVAHLVGADQFWNLSIRSGLDGSPSRLLASFDPRATPAAMVDAVRDASPADTLASYLDASDALCTTVESLDHDGWTVIAESPVGHVAMSSLAHHALWDSWVHERDVLVPLGMAQELEADEITASLRYVAALAPAFALQSDPTRVGALVLDVTDPDARVVVTVDGDVAVDDRDDVRDDALVVRGAAVTLLDTLSVRVPWTHSFPTDKAWLLTGLAEVFAADPVA